MVSVISYSDLFLVNRIIMNDYYFFDDMYFSMSNFKIAFHYPLAEAVWKQARMLLIPVFRNVLIGESEIEVGKQPIITSLGEQIVLELEDKGRLGYETGEEAAVVLEKLVAKLNKSDREILAFYFYSKEEKITAITEQYQQMNEESEDVDEDVEIGKEITSQISSLTDGDLIKFCVEELHYLQDIISSDSINCFDSSVIASANESFRDYLGAKNSEIELFQRFENEGDYWERVMGENNQEDEDDTDFEDDDIE